MIDVNVKTTVTARQIADQMVAAIEGGSTEWCTEIKRTGACRAQKTAERPWYSSPDFYEGEFTLRVGELTDEVYGEVTYHNITRTDFVNGLQIMAYQYPTDFADLVRDEGDATTADVFLQCVVLRNVVYG